MVRTKKSILSIFFGSVIVHAIYYTICTTLLTWCNRWIISFFDTICYVSKRRYKKISNLMILDNSDIDYSLMLLFVYGFLVSWKIEPNSRASRNTWCTTWLQRGHVKVVKKNKMWCQRQQFFRFYYN